jgi:S1-C subfamily serine protease
MAGDVITAVDNEPVKDLDDMLTLLERRAPGETVTLSIWRSGSTRRQPLTLVAGE